MMMQLSYVMVSIYSDVGILIYLLFKIDAPAVSDCIDGDVRLIGGPTPQEGTIEICMGHVWGGICQYRWDSTDANVACFQLGYQPVGNY